MRTGYFVIIDLGTTNLRAALVDTSGTIVSSVSQELMLNTPHPGWAEQDPSEWWKVATTCLRKLCQSAESVGLGKVIGMGVTGHQPSPVLVGGHGEPLTPSLIWMDRRTAPQCDTIRELVGEERVYELTGLRIDAMYALSKLLWWRQNAPRVVADTRWILQPKDFILFMLTGEPATDYASAAATQMLDFRALTWSEEILDTFGISKDKLPPLRHATDTVGRVSQSAASQTGLPAGLPVICGAGDTTVSAIGGRLTEGGRACVNIGTSSDVMMCTDTPCPDPRRRFGVYPHALRDLYVLIAGANTSGASLRWFRDAFCGQERDVAAQLGQDPYDLMTSEAAQSRPGARGLIFLPYLMGERSPIFDPSARGAFFGFTLDHRKGDFIRAVMEGVALSIRHRLDAIEEASRTPVTSLLLSGGGARSALWQQIVADVTQRDLVLPRSTEATTLGMCALLSIAHGLHGSASEACEVIVPISESVSANRSNAGIYARCYDRYRQLYERAKTLFLESGTPGQHPRD